MKDTKVLLVNLHLYQIQKIIFKGEFILEINKTIGLIRENVKKAIIGKDEIIDLMLMVLISSGHVLIEDVPGLGKTTLVSALAKSLGCSFQRIQCVPYSP